MIKIKASLLKWVSVDFEFWYNEEQHYFEGIDADGDIFYDERCGFVAPDYAIHIDEKEYEKACIEKIKEMFNFDNCINIKIIKDNGLIEVCYVPAGNAMMEETTLINADPRPNEDRYEIKIT